MENKMFCFQCQEAAGCTGCTIKGVCGKTPELAKLQDLLIYTTKGLAEVSIRAREEKIKVSSNINHMVTMNLFTTITNANFDNEIFYLRVKETIDLKEELLSKLGNKANLSEAALFVCETKAEMEAKAPKIGVLATENEDIRSLRELIIYGLKGLSAYMKHANALGYDDENISEFMQRALTAVNDDNVSLDEYIALTLETGKVGVDGMALLDKANTESYGNPEITKVNIGVGKIQEY